MNLDDPARQAVAHARRLLTASGARSNPWAPLGAAALMAAAAVMLAGAVVLGPGVEVRDSPPSTPD